MKSIWLKIQKFKIASKKSFKRVFNECATRVHRFARMMELFFCLKN